MCIPALLLFYCLVCVCAVLWPFMLDRREMEEKRSAFASPGKLLQEITLG